MSAPRPARWPGTIWCTRRDFKGCYVRCAEDDLIQIVTRDGASSLEVSRPEARLLAKRLNECLDATVKR